MRKYLSLGFLISFTIIKAFQNSLEIALIFIKISFFKSKFAKISWKVLKFCRFPLIFRLIFLIFSLASGAPPPETPTNPYFQNFLNFSLNFRENFDKILTNFQKIAKFTCKFSKNYKIFIDFLTFFENFRVWKNAKFLLSTMKKYPPPNGTIAPWTPPQTQNPV